MTANYFQQEMPLLLASFTDRLEDDCACPESPSLWQAEYEIPVDNDCACPYLISPSQSLLTGGLYRQAEQVYEDDLPGGFYLLYSPFSPLGPVVVNRAARERWQTFARPQPLSARIDIQLAEQGLLLPVDFSGRLPLHRPQMLTVWLHVTNACNLDCPYCYVRKSSARMSEAIGLEAVDNVFRTAQRRGFQRVKLKYAGGEATLHMRLIRRLAAYAQLLAAQSNLGLEQVILSNGTLLQREDVAWMLDNSIRLMISLDGLGTVHDRQRPTRRGEGSFDQVRYTIEEVILPAGLVPFVSITVTRLNSAHVAETVRWVLEHKLPVSLNFYRLPSTAPEDLAAEEQALIEGMRAAYQVYEEILPEQPFFNGLLDRVKAGSHLHACGVGTSYLVITHEGKVAQCQMLLEQASWPVEGTDLLAHVQRGFIPLMTVEQKPSCSTCPYRYLCAGGCPVETYFRTGRWDAPHPNCRIYQALLPQALRLEGLRLLKVNGYLQ